MNFKQAKENRLLETVNRYCQLQEQLYKLHYFTSTNKDDWPEDKLEGCQLFFFKQKLFKSKYCIIIFYIIKNEGGIRERLAELRCNESQVQAQYRKIEEVFSTGAPEGNVLAHLKNLKVLK